MGSQGNLRKATVFGPRMSRYAGRSIASQYNTAKRRSDVKNELMTARQTLDATARNGNGRSMYIRPETAERFSFAGIAVE